MTDIFTGSVDGFLESGETTVRGLIELSGLTPTSKVLDVGSGVGRLAIPLTEYLGREGSYEGLELVEDAVLWCSVNVTAKHENFRFRAADVFNAEYNPGGLVQASNYVFPYPEATFDLAVLISVFTHMLPPDMENYVREVARVLKPGGRCLATYFLLNEESRALMSRGESSVIFPHERGNHAILSKRTPELGVAYEEGYVRGVFERGDAYEKPRIHYGGWCGRAPLWSAESGLGDQDVVVATKK